jgi:hypothetical protein
MNSKQRRSISRKLKHKITLEFHPDHYYPEFDDKVEKGMIWCKKKCTGVYSVDVESYFEKVIFHFEKERDAIIFALKWQ